MSKNHSRATEQFCGRAALPVITNNNDNNDHDHGLID